MGGYLKLFIYFNLSIQFVKILSIGAGAFGTLVQVLPNCMSSSRELWETRNVFEAVKDRYLIKVVEEDMANLAQEVVVLKSKMLSDRALILFIFKYFCYIKIVNNIKNL